MNYSQSPFVFSCINFRNGALLTYMHLLKAAPDFLLGTASWELKRGLCGR